MTDLVQRLREWADAEAGNDQVIQGLVDDLREAADLIEAQAKRIDDLKRSIAQADMIMQGGLELAERQEKRIEELENMLRNSATSE